MLGDLDKILKTNLAQDKKKTLREHNARDRKAVLESRDFCKISV